MSSLAPPSFRPALVATDTGDSKASPAADAGDRVRTARVFVAALGPMLTVAALRTLVIDAHGGSAASLHAFVALGMTGAALGAPLVAARADRTGSHARLAIALALLDAVVTFASAHVTSAAALFVLRPVHGLASMGLLALLFGDLRRSSKRFVAHAGGAMIAALAIGPGIGGALSRIGVAIPFEAAALVSIGVAASLAWRPLSSARAPGARRSDVRRLLDTAMTLRAPLTLIALQRAAIGAFIASFAVRARAAGASDATVGASFSVFLVAFAITVTLVGRSEPRRSQSDRIPLGGALFAAGFLFLAALTKGAALPFLALAGVGAGLVYAPCLEIASLRAPEARGSASTMALVHAAGALGMIAGPALAAVADLALADMTSSGRGSLFLVLAGGAQALAALALHTECRALETHRKIP